ncbi:hypothetical protein BSKO_05811 [Bryopsis sp. KO-2023]|nr:hypothetical protein BSKO_05811 [Bryopsis sp. KO-2023]
MIGLATKHVLCVVLVAAVIVADVDSRNFNDGAADRGLLRKEGKPKEKGKNKKRKGSGPLRREERPPFLEGPSELEQPGNPSNAPPGDPRPDKPRNPPSPPSKSGRRRSGNISSDLREAVRSGDFNRVAALLNENNDVSGLAKGFTFSPQDRGIDLARTPERLRDGDVVTMKGIAKSALDTGQARKLARIVAKSIFPGQGELT